MSKYIMRLDDAAVKMDVAKWERIERLLDSYEVKPLVGVIPDCKDPCMEQYEADPKFWDKVQCWITKDWTIALHGFEHVYHTEDGGLNPVNKRSEFAGLSLDEQKIKIRKGIDIFASHGINLSVFFAPSHTFDKNTLNALKEESSIKFISDTVANKPYTKYDFTFVPQQSGSVRKLPFNVVTFCYHPNTMQEKDFQVLNDFLERNSASFIHFPVKECTRKYSILDKILNFIYFARRKIRENGDM